MSRLEHRIIRLEEVKGIVGLSSSTILRREKKGLFPKRINLGERAVGWMLGEVYDWVDARRVDSSVPIDTLMKRLELNENEENDDIHD